MSQFLRVPIVFHPQAGLGQDEDIVAKIHDDPVTESTWEMVPSQQQTGSPASQLQATAGSADSKTDAGLAALPDTAAAITAAALSSAVATMNSPQHRELSQSSAVEHKMLAASLPHDAKAASAASATDCKLSSIDAELTAALATLDIEQPLKNEFVALLCRLGFTTLRSLAFFSVGEDMGAIGAGWKVMPKKRAQKWVKDEAAKLTPPLHPSGFVKISNKPDPTKSALALDQ
jgi:hypothetical protein